MGFKRAQAIGDQPDHETLTRDLVGIGMNFAADANPDAMIEETLVQGPSFRASSKTLQGSTGRCLACGD